MNTKAAAEALGVGVHQVRWLIKSGRLKARKRRTKRNQHGYEWEITEREVERARLRNRPGRPRKIVRI